MFVAASACCCGLEKTGSRAILLSRADSNRSCSLLPQDDSAENSDAPSNGAVLSTSTPPLVDNPKQPQVLDCSPLCRLRVYFAVAILLAPEPTPQMRPVSALCTSHAAQGSNNRQHYEATACKIREAERERTWHASRISTRGPGRTLPRE